MAGQKRHNHSGAQLKTLPDESYFRISKYVSGVVYRLEKKGMGLGTYTSLQSGRTYQQVLSTWVYPCNEVGKLNT